MSTEATRECEGGSALAYCRITAPISGRIGLRQVDLGNYVQVGGESIGVLTRLQPISVVFTVAEDHLPAVMEQIQAGKKPPVAIYARSGRTLIAEGELASVDSQVDLTTGTDIQISGAILPLVRSARYWREYSGRRASFRRPSRQ